MALPDLIDRLGLRPGDRLSMVGYWDDELARLANARGVAVGAVFDGEFDLLIALVRSREELAGLGRLMAALSPRGALWVLRHKGPGRALDDVDVIAAGRDLGLVDNKITAYSPSLAAMRLVRPALQRRPPSAPAGLGVRPGRPADVGLIQELILRLAEYEGLLDQARASQADLDRLLFGADRQAEVLIAEIAGRPVGFALFFTSVSTFLGRAGLYLEDLFVLPDARRLGAGTALIAAVAKICQDRGGGRLEWSVLNWNQSAIDFYHGLGARALEAWTVYRIEGDALARLALRGAEAPSRDRVG